MICPDFSSFASLCDNILALLHLSVAGNIDDSFAFGLKQLAKWKLILSFIDASQPIFDYSLDHANPLIYEKSARRTAF